MTNDFLKDKNARVITPQESGCTQDEYNNFLIDMVRLATSKEIPAASVTVGKSVAVTITVNRPNYYIYLNEQNN